MEGNRWKILLSFSTLWPNCWHVYSPPHLFSVFFVSLPFYICSQADLLTSSTNGGEQDRKRDREKGERGEEGRRGESCYNFPLV